MIKLIFLFSCILVTAQQKAVSPFSIKDYENMKMLYLENAFQNKDQLLYLNQTYYSKQKLDSLLMIKDELKKQYLIESGKKANEITEKDLQQIKDEFLLPKAIFKIKGKQCEFYGIDYEYSPTLFVETNDGKSINIRFNDNEYVEGIHDRNSELATGNYYYSNHQLKRTNSIFKHNINIGLFQEFDSSGKLTKEINWQKDFPISQKQAETMINKEITQFLTNKYKNNLEIVEQFKKSKTTLYKDLYKEQKPAWFFRYNQIEGSIDAKTGKLIEIHEIMIIG